MIEDLVEIEEHAERISSANTDVLVLGVGGSSLDGQALIKACGTHINDRPRIKFTDNLSPLDFPQSLSNLNPKHTHILAISKTRGTIDLHAQLAIIMRWLKEPQCEYKDHITVITKSETSSLRKLIDMHGLPSLEHHSQLQLYIEGSRDKNYSFITVGRTDNPAINIPELPDDIDVEQLAGLSLHDIINAMSEGTHHALSETGQPVRQTHIKEMNEKNIGALFMHFFLETKFSSALLGVDIYGQPGVERGKNITKTFLNKLKKENNMCCNFFIRSQYFAITN